MDTLPLKKPRTMAEMLPELSCLMSKDALQTLTLTATKKPRPTVANTRTNEKVYKPLTLAEMKNEIKSLQVNSPKRKVPATASTKRWNSSCKLENKRVSHTGNGQMKLNSVRKVLTFQAPKPVAAKPLTTSRITLLSAETPKFRIPVIKMTKPQARNKIRISGICEISETPVITKSESHNKENIPTFKETICKKLIATPKSSLRKKVLASRIPATPISNDSWTSGDGDSSFLQNEKEMEVDESKTKSEEQTLQSKATSPPISTPFTEYRSVTDFFNNSTDEVEDLNDNTIMCFNNTVSKENTKREESVIVSLCDMLNKATMSTQTTSDIDDLIEMQKQNDSNIKMIENCIQAFTDMKEKIILQNKSIQKKIKDRQQTSTSIKETCKPMSETEVLVTEKVNVKFNACPSIKPVLKSPLYKIPKRSPCLKQKVIYKSMPNIPASVTPLKNMGQRALSVYMKIKQQNDYLATPISKPRPTQVPNTNTKTSHNLQKQLDKLYEGN